ncbi:MAG TPA: sigma-70 family RNA polymerase sigma factor [Thermoanaerobaculia bacterium]|nr:sigma-70 family RNA polymerase sigma factor [Thermoanaerobaculia bacterium]
MLDQNALEVSSPSASAENGPAAQPAPAETAAPVVVPPPAPAPARRKPSARPADKDEPEDVETLYVKHRTLLFFVACRKFRIPECDAENLIQEVFLSFLQTGTKIDNTRAWLVAAMCNASRHYWRAQGRTESLPEDFVEQSDPATHGLAEQFAKQMTVRQALKYLQPRCRETLWLHYFEGRSAADVARELDTTSRYAEKLIHNCLKRVREIYISITTVARR